MARIVTMQQQPPDTAELKKDIKKQVEVDLRKQARRKKLFRCFSCLVLLIAVFGAVVFIGAWLVARTGLYEIPMISSWAFQVPEPVHRVDTSKGYTADDLLLSMRTDINNLIETQYPGQLLVSEASISLDEEIITAYLAETIQPSLVASGFILNQFQLAVEPEAIEIFGYLSRGDRPVYVTITAVPTILEDDISLEIKQARLGNLPVPKSIISIFFGPLVESMLKAFQLPTVGFVSLRDIELMYSKIKLIGAIEYTTFR